MPTTRINTAFVQFVPMASHPFPDAQVMAVTGPDGFPAIDFAQSNTFQLDLTAKLSSMRPALKNGIQSMYVDASGMNFGPCLIYVFGGPTNQPIVIMPNTQGYYPIICPKSGPLVLTFQNFNGTGHGASCAIGVFLMNVPQVSGTWSASQQVSTPTQNVNEIIHGSYGNTFKRFIADQQFCYDYVVPPASGNTTFVQYSYPLYFITSIQCSFDPTGGGGNNYMFFADTNYGNVWGFRFAFPASRPSGVASPTALEFKTPPGFYFMNQAPGTRLNWYTFAPINGAVTVNISYGLLNFADL